MYRKSTLQHLIYASSPSPLRRLLHVSTGFLTLSLLAACASGNDDVQLQPTLDTVTQTDAAGTSDTTEADTGTRLPDTGEFDDTSDTATIEDTSPEDAGTDDVMDATADTDDTIDTSTEPTDTGSDTPGGEDADDMEVTAEPQPCDPPLEITPNAPHVLSYDLLTFVASGGTGEYRFSLTENNSGAIINQFTGAYLSGPTEAVSDGVLVEDLGCIGEAAASVSVVAPLQVLPTEITVLPSSEFTFEIQGGSGQVEFVLLTPISEEPVEVDPEIVVTIDGQVTLGTKLGTWEVQATDIGLGTVRVATVTVSEDADIIPVSPVVGVPPGSQVPLSVLGGSNVYNLAASSDVVEIQEGWAIGIEPGTATVTATDQFTGNQTEITVHVLGSAEVDYPRTGDNTSAAELRVADFNQDGFDDFALALREADVTGFQSGAVFIYHGTETGPSPTPTQVLPGSERREEFGTSLALADLTNDGRPDLIVGARLADINANDTGAIFVHEALEDGTFDTSPTFVLGGPFGGDQHGWSVAVCDFNGDGKLDIASGAYVSEDKEQTPQSSNQGAIRIWFGYDAGFNTDPDFAIYGNTVDELGEWSYKNEMRLGWYMAADDMDNDGNCDLAVTALHWEPDGESGLWGAVFIYKGLPATETSLGGITTLPVRAFANIVESDIQSELGRTLTMADVNSDGYADLGIGHWRFDSQDSSADHGAAWLIAGGPLPSTPATVFENPKDVSAWSAINYQGYDYYGWNVRIADFTGDGITDILTGNWQDEVAGGTSNTGTVALYQGTENGWPALEPLWLIPGSANGDRFGHVMEVVSDLNGDGAPEIAVFAARNDDFGTDVGRPYLYWGQPGILGIEIDDGSDTDGADPVDATDSIDAVDSGDGQDTSDGGDTDGTDAANEDGSDQTDANDGTSGDEGTDSSNGTDSTDAGDGVDATDSTENSIFIPTEPFIPLEMPDEASGHEFGRGAAVVPDVNGDGLNDLLIGAPNADHVMTNGGAAYLYLGIGGGFTTAPSMTFKEYFGHSSGDQLGFYVATAGDFDNNGTNDITIVARGDDRLNNLQTRDEYEVIGTCNSSQNNPGALLVFRSNDGALPDDTPMLIHYGPDPGQALEIAEGGGDFNGDGYDDIVYGQFAYDIPGANNVGAYGIVFGREPVADKIILVCEADVLVEGTANGNNLGRGVTYVGDIDGDGCDEVAAGSYLEDLGLNNQGTVRILFGYNDTDPTTTCATSPRTLLLRSGVANAQAGFSLDAGDVDGDGTVDIAVGGINLTVNNTAVGGAWIIPGAYLAQLEPEPFVQGTTPATLHLFAPPGITANLRVEGEASAEQFGRSVAVIDGAGPGGNAVLAVGGPFGNLTGVERTGTARVYTFIGDGTQPGDGLQPNPLAIVSGEMDRPEGRIGERVTGGLVGSTPVLVVGGFDGSAFGLDQGAAYILPLPAGN